MGSDDANLKCAILCPAIEPNEKVSFVIIVYHIGFYTMHANIMLQHKGGLFDLSGLKVYSFSIICAGLLILKLRCLTCCDAGMVRMQDK